MMTDSLKTQIEKALQGAITFRQDLHKFPELTWQEKETSEKVASALEKIPHLKVKKGLAKYGVIADLKGDKEGPMLALRADMDALAITEKTPGIDYISCHDGVMHACGHDGHVANLLAAARVLSSLKSRLHGSIRFIFQPAEEGGAGAKKMVEDGALEGVDAIYGLHGWPELKEGEIYTCAGPMMAGNSMLSIEIEGKGGHAGFPHLATDQILAGCKLAERLSYLGARHLHPASPFVLSITQFHGGSTHNVLPDKVALGGTLRYLEKDTLELAHSRIKTICSALAAEMHVKVTPSLKEGYPPLTNDLKATAFLESVARGCLGEGRVRPLSSPTMGSEDFSYYLEKVPGSYFFLGLDDGRKGGFPSLHHPEFNFNDKSLKTGINLFVQLALSYGKKNHLTS